MKGYVVTELMTRRVRDSRPSVRGPEDIVTLMRDRATALEKEHFWVLCLNSKNSVIAIETVSIGSLNATIVHPREVFKVAYLNSAASIILVHNHPSGDPTPSHEDIETTCRFAKIGELLGIALLDHVIIGSTGSPRSLKESGVF